MYHSLTASPDNTKLYLFGGITNGKYLNNLWAFKIYSPSWEEFQTLGIKSVLRTITLWTGEDIEIEVDFSKRVKNDTITYTTNGDKPEPRCSHSLIYFSGAKDYLILFGGQGQKTVGTSTYTIVLGDLWVFSIELKRWTEAFPTGDKPLARKDAQLQQLDSRRMVLQGGTDGDIFFDDIWLYNIETNTWTEWVQPIKPEKRSKHAMVRISKGLIIFGGYKSDSLDQSAIDKAFSTERTFQTECQTIFSLYNVSFVDIGQDYYEKQQEALYNSTNSTCFLRTEPMPTLDRHYTFPTGIWILNMTTCNFNCSERGTCQSSRCICDYGYHGDYCEKTDCIGSLCFYDFDVFENEHCYHCSGNGVCSNGVCLCNEGYIGEDCSALSCENSCNDRGSCYQMFPVSQCDCAGKDGGDDCSVTFCLNNCNTPQGSCNYTTGACTCEGDYIGSDCSIVSLTAESD